MIYGFGDSLAFSRGARERTDCETIRALILGCVGVVKTDGPTDRGGTDYVATLRGGRAVNVDAKARRPGASRFWNGEPDLALEVWSVMPGGRFNTPKEHAKAGWTLSERNTAELVLFTFDPADTAEAFLLPAQHLRMAFRRNLPGWAARFKGDTQSSERGPARWQSQCVFVPYTVAWEAIKEASRGCLVVPAPSIAKDGPLVQGDLFDFGA